MDKLKQVSLQQLMNSIEFASVVNVIASDANYNITSLWIDNDDDGHPCVHIWIEDEAIIIHLYSKADLAKYKFYELSEMKFD